MKKLNITAVVVTHNRFTLLTEAVEALRNQTLPLSNIIIINNGSTDDTTGWLNAQIDLMIIHQANLGAAAGFSIGIRHAAATGANFIWIMDDDTICDPTALEKMVEKMQMIHEPIGFLSSRCNWIDGSPHLMNIPAIKPLFNSGIPFNKYDVHKLILVESSSFVSLLVNTEVVKTVGLPYKEFFIWGDDQEFTRRITKHGYPGFYCAESIVLHKTAVNTFTDYYNDTANNIWKHRHGFRNEFFMVKKNKGLLYFLAWLPAKVIYASLKTIRIRKKEYLKFIIPIWSAAWESLFFNPKIDMLQHVSINSDQQIN